MHSSSKPKRKGIIFCSYWSLKENDSEIDTVHISLLREREIRYSGHVLKFVTKESDDQDAFCIRL